MNHYAVEFWRSQIIGWTDKFEFVYMTACLIEFQITHKNIPCESVICRFVLIGYAQQFESCNWIPYHEKK